MYSTATQPAIERGRDVSRIGKTQSAGVVRRTCRATTTFHGATRPTGRLAAERELRQTQGRVVFSARNGIWPDKELEGHLKVVDDFVDRALTFASQQQTRTLAAERILRYAYEAVVASAGKAQWRGGNHDEHLRHVEALAAQASAMGAVGAPPQALSLSSTFHEGA